MKSRYVDQSVSRAESVVSAWTYDVVPASKLCVQMETTLSVQRAPSDVVKNDQRPHLFLQDDPSDSLLWNQTTPQKRTQSLQKQRPEAHRVSFRIDLFDCDR